MDETITTIITNTYGKTPMAKELASDLISKIPKWSDERERHIMMTCWSWFSGGSTAEVVARKIEEALTA